MRLIEPIAGAAAATADLGEEKALVVADYHAGIEAALRYEGVELEHRDDDRRERLIALIERTSPDRVIFLGDLAHWIGEPVGAELEELHAVIEAVTDRVPATLVKGNHDGAIEDALDTLDIDVTDGGGIRIGDVGFAHGHTWPSPDVVAADVLCTGHEHPFVRLEDDVGGSRIERVWLRGTLAADPFESFYERDLSIVGDLVVFPAFNDLSSGTWINVDGQDFLSPFLPEGLRDGEAFLLDGTRLGDYRHLS